MVWNGISKQHYLGQLTRSDIDALRRVDTGKTLAEHMQGLGLDVSSVGKGAICPVDRVKAYLELHIEQGPLLEFINRPVGIATAIRGNSVIPSQSASGAMLILLPFPAACELTPSWRRPSSSPLPTILAGVLLEAGHDDFGFTCGIFHTDVAQEAMTKVPGEVSTLLNIGATTNELLTRKEMHRSIMARAEELVKEHNVKFELGPRVGTEAVDSTNRCCKPLNGRRGIGVPPYRLSTVGHDAAMFARKGIPASVILVRNTNGSHNPEEHMEMDDFILGLKVLGSGILKLC